MRFRTAESEQLARVQRALDVSELTLGNDCLAKTKINFCNKKGKGSTNSLEPLSNGEPDIVAQWSNTWTDVSDALNIETSEIPFAGTVSRKTIRRRRQHAASSTYSLATSRLAQIAVETELKQIDERTSK